MHRSLARAAALLAMLAAGAIGMTGAAQSPP